MIIEPNTIAKFCCQLLAQAGGGGNFGGGGGGGGGFSGGGSGGDGGGELIGLLILLIIEHPFIGIPLVILVIGVGIWIKMAEKNIRVTRTIRRGRKVQEQSLREFSLDQIESRDPGFDLNVFMDRIGNAFVTTQYAWSEQELNRCRAFISDGVYERFDLYIAMQKAENIRNRMKNVSISNQSVTCVTSDTHFDTIHVRITAQAISYNEDLTSGKRVSGNSDRSPITFTEIWSFSRRPGVTTNVEASLLDGICPNCSGPVDVVDRAQCPQCDSFVNSGMYDWVLAEITQDEEWVVPPARHHVAGWEEMAAKDQSLNFQHLEDRASVIFWRCMMSIYFDDYSLASPVVESSRKSVPPLWDNGKGQFWNTPAVGVVEIVRCLPATNDDFDRVHVLVRWSATRAEGDRRKPRKFGAQRIYSHSLVLKRKSTAKTDLNSTFSALTCPNCGGAANIGKSATCEFCDTPLNDGAYDWVLEDVIKYDSVVASYHDDERRMESERFANEPELLAALVKMVAADGELHEKERQYVTELAERRGVTGEKLEQIFSTALSDHQPIQVPETPKHAKHFMDQLVRAALIDGKITRQEQEILAGVCEQINWSSADLRYAVARTRKELFKQAKQIIRDARQKKPPVILRKPPVID